MFKIHQSSDGKCKVTKRYTPYLLGVIVLIALFLRLWGLTWGLPNTDHYFSYHPDEASVLNAAQRVDFFTGHLDPGFYNYGSLYIYILNICILIGSLARLINLSNSDIGLVMRDLHLTGRLISVALGTASVLMIYLLGRRMYGRRTGVLAALMLAVLPLHVMYSHFLAVDVPATFLVLCSLVFAARIVEGARLRYYLLSGLFAGLAGATKYNTFLVVVAPFVTHTWATKGRTITRLFSWKLAMLILAAAFGFLIGCPGILLYPQHFWHDFIYEARHMQTGHGLVFVNTGSGYAYHLIHSLLPGMGIPVLALAFIGLFYAIRRWTPQDMMLIAFVVVYYALIGAVAVRFARYTMPILPVLVLLGARIPGKIMDRMDEAPGIWCSAVRVIIGACTGLAVIYTLVYSAALDNMLATKDTRDRALDWIRENVPAGSTIGMPTVPWFYTPPLDPRFGFGSVQDRYETSQKVADYAIAVDPRKEFNAGLLKTSSPEYVVMSEFEYEDHMRVGTQAAQEYFSVLKEDYSLTKRFISSPTIFGIRFPLPVSLPHDMSYANPTILIYARKDLAETNG